MLLLVCLFSLQTHTYTAHNGNSVIVLEALLILKLLSIDSNA